MSALELFNRIGTGQKNAVRRCGNSYIDRQFRDLINKANRSGTDFIIPSKHGYYRPNLKDRKDIEAAIHYLNSELKRCREIAFKYKQMKTYLQSQLDKLEFEEWFRKKEAEEKRNQHEGETKRSPPKGRHDAATDG